MYRLFVLLTFLLVTASEALAIPAYPNKIPVVVNGQVVNIQLFGDEHHKWAESEDGYTIIQNEKQQWCYAQLNDQGELIPSCWQLQKTYLNEEAFQSFISSIPRHLKQPFSKKSFRHGQHQNKTAIGERRVLIIIMEYKDLALTKTSNDFYRLFNEEGYSDDYAQGSVRDFYLSSSYNQLSLISDVYGPYKTTHEMSYYGKNSVTDGGGDMNAFVLFEEAIQNVANDTDLSLYDGDDDGFIDNVHIIFAGYGEEAGASANAIWSHEATFYRPYTIQGMKIDRYSCAPELRGNSGNGISRIGPHCHEIGHALGAMDYYDTDYATDGEYAGTGKWDVMASGSWNNDGITPGDFNPYVKAYNYGWISPKTLPAGNVIIQPSYKGRDNYFLLRTSEQGDYYLIENRSQLGWGTGVPGEGLLLFHIHSGLEAAGNKINASYPQKCYIVCASSHYTIPSSQPATYGEINSNGCPYPGSSGNHSFGKDSTPMAFYWDNDECGIELEDIIMLSDGSIQLTNKSVDAGYVPPVMTRLFFEGFEDDLKIMIEPSNSRQWEKIENPENDVSYIDHPLAYAGAYSLQLSAVNQYYNETNAFEFHCQPNNLIGMVKLKLFFTSYALKPRKKNLIKIGYRHAEQDEWTFESFESTVNQIWQEVQVSIPIADPLNFRIEGTAFIGSILAIDNIEVMQEIPNNETSLRNTLHLSKESTREFYYTLDGRKHLSPQKGINILQTGNGEYKKICIK